MAQIDVDHALEELRDATQRYEAADKAHDAAILRYKVAFCAQHAIEEGKDVMLTQYRRYFGSPVEKRRAKIIRISVRGYDVVLSTVPYTKSGEPGTRRMMTSVSQDEWEHLS